MLKEIHQTPRIIKSLSKKGTWVPLNKPAHIKAFQRINNIMEATQREFEVKDKQSQISASKVILTA
jgi:hypothetical protein